MLNEEDFARRYTEQLCKHFGKRVEQWMHDIAPDAYEMYIDDGTVTPEDLADEEADEMRRIG